MAATNKSKAQAAAKAVAEPEVTVVQDTAKRELTLTELVREEVARGMDPTQASNKAVQLAESRRRDLLKVYKEEPVQSTYIDPAYAAWLGNNTQLQINGISVAVPVNGSRVEIPASFADLLEEKRIKINAIVNKQKNMSNSTNNIETTPGELRFF